MPLLDAIHRATAHAKATGALLPLASEHLDLPAAGIDFRVHWLSSLALKDAAKLLSPAPADKDFNPFLPYEQDLHVADLSATHIALLNKFPLFEHHTLMVTRIFEEQLAPLTLADFDAAATMLRELDGLAFFNGGQVGGASQRHKHLQWVPNDTFSLGTALTATDGTKRVAAYDFRHAILSLDGSCEAEKLFAAFQSACIECGLNAADGRLAPYNLLFTRRWMLLVPRSRECWGDGDNKVSMNAMSFAGSLFVRRPEQIESVRASGPLALLRAVTYPA